MASYQEMAVHIKCFRGQGLTQRDTKLELVKQTIPSLSFKIQHRNRSYFSGLLSRLQLQNLLSYPPLRVSGYYSTIYPTATRTPPG